MWNYYGLLFLAISVAYAGTVIASAIRYHAERSKP